MKKEAEAGAAAKQEEAKQVAVKKWSLEDDDEDEDDEDGDDGEGSAQPTKPAAGAASESAPASEPAASCSPRSRKKHHKRSLLVSSPPSLSAELQRVSVWITGSALSSMFTTLLSEANKTCVF